ncbi:AAA family ATPase [Kitasatospora cheerisanensis]|uniref:TmrB n=1 Tax=Kitasatospora cheerisanensis KCTC 2395 TaxID=1348663 RepID=A0A066Z2P7_9ACTN|nr:AAA family ATPase [Kitasatospora cheerisanensis]KDN88053.1 TmrB [Kitasatospora cheerisanensis KCTC 2395]
MLVWINGPFGGGKTQTAHNLARRLPGAAVCDPEHLGFGLHRMLPPALRGDFQDLPAWRTGTVDMLALAARRHPGPLIVPMTVTEPGYFTETVGRLRELGHDVRHFTLLADRATVLRRLAEREPVHHLRRLARLPAPPQGESFAVRRLDDCLHRLAAPAFATHLHTDRLTVTQVADRIARLAGLHPRPDTDSAPRAALRRAAVKLRALRLD